MPYTAPPERRRIHLMRHGAVDYFRADGTPVAAEGVALNDAGRRQAEAAGALFAQCGVRFDRVIASGLPRTLETARLALAAAGQPALDVEVEPALQEIRGGRLSTIAPDQIETAFLGAFGTGADGDVESMRFLNGESVGELLDRVLAAFDRVLARDDWQSLLMVLHGGVNRAIVSRARAGRRAFFGGMEQSPACINVLDAGVGAQRGRLLVRAVNLAPTQWLHQHERSTTMETLLAQYLAAGPRAPLVPG